MVVDPPSITGKWAASSAFGRASKGPGTWVEWKELGYAARYNLGKLMGGPPPSWS